MPPFLQILRLTKQGITNPVHLRAQQKTAIEAAKTPLRHEVINYLLRQSGNKETVYLEIGVCNPQINFEKIVAAEKYGVDPGIEFKENPVNFQMTSDEFFRRLTENRLLHPTIQFDVIFIDGLHLAAQVETDVKNALKFLKDDGFLVLHDCNPPTEYHAREDRLYTLSPALGSWNGTTWKAFYKCRLNPVLSCCCIDSDWGIGIISQQKYFPPLNRDINPYFEFAILDEHRQEMLNLIDFDALRKVIESRQSASA